MSTPTVPRSMTPGYAPWARLITGRNPKLRRYVLGHGHPAGRYRALLRAGLLPSDGRHNVGRGAIVVRLDGGMVRAYAFNHEEAVRCLEKALGVDSDLAIARWGIAYRVGPYNKAWDAFDFVDRAVSLARAHLELELAAKGRLTAAERGHHRGTTSATIRCVRQTG